MSSGLAEVEPSPVRTNLLSVWDCLPPFLELLLVYLVMVVELACQISAKYFFKDLNVEF